MGVTKGRERGLEVEEGTGYCCGQHLLLYRMHLIETVCLEKCAQLGFAEVQVDVKAIKFLRLFALGKEGRS